ncbi:hypothetical protein HPB47_010979 [Ixodes persulcatus]|uniref:Uncharacterized protein n=1 Tax=Ixodes persulcatus TaxID=34615 RepID=A0AC60NXJ2_IXOPE|nr:hypothetical protein HPB47_010979 [Ixodes persulcatus]
MKSISGVQRMLMRVLQLDEKDVRFPEKCFFDAPCYKVLALHICDRDLYGSIIEPHGFCTAVCEENLEEMGGNAALANEFELPFSDLTPTEREMVLPKQPSGGASSESGRVVTACDPLEMAHIKWTFEVMKKTGDDHKAGSLRYQEAARNPHARHRRGSQEGSVSARRPEGRRNERKMNLSRPGPEDSVGGGKGLGQRGGPAKQAAVARAAEGNRGFGIAGRLVIKTAFRGTRQPADRSRTEAVVLGQAGTPQMSLASR